MIYTENKIKLYSKLESVFIKEFMDEIKKIHPAIWYFKSHGESMQVRGIPDIIMCFYGTFIAIEFKIMRNGIIKYSPLQEYTLELIDHSCGFAITIWYDNRNENVGIGSIRLKNKKEAACFLLKTIEPIAINIKNMITKLKEYKKEEKDENRN